MNWRRGAAGVVVVLLILLFIFAEFSYEPETARTAAEAGTIQLRAIATNPAPWWQRLISLFGLGGMVGIAWLLSSHRDRFPKRIVLWGVGLQLVFALFVLKTRTGQRLFSFLNDVVVGLLDFTAEGSRFVFGEYLDMKFSFALNVLPTILFFSSLMTVLYHLGVMQKMVSGLAWLMQRTMATSGSETLSAAANIFVARPKPHSS